MTAPSPERSGGWMVIVTTDAKGRVRAFPYEGRDQDMGFQEIERRHKGHSGLWMVHWEKGFASETDARNRADQIELDVGPDGKPGAATLN